MPLMTLPLVAVRALELADTLCWDSLTRGDTGAFVRQAAICAELWQFGVCADLLDEGHDPYGERWSSRPKPPLRVALRGPATQIPELHVPKP
jgi:hypothetical protein